jgi:hypothetical protein
MEAVYPSPVKTPMHKLWLLHSAADHSMTVSQHSEISFKVYVFAGETNEIAARIRRATMNINVEIETLLEFLAHKGAIG